MYDHSGKSIDPETLALLVKAPTGLGNDPETAGSFPHCAVLSHCLNNVVPNNDTS